MKNINSMYFQVKYIFKMYPNTKTNGAYIFNNKCNQKFLIKSNSFFFFFNFGYINHFTFN